MFRVCGDEIQMSNLYWKHQEKKVQKRCALHWPVSASSSQGKSLHVTAASCRRFKWNSSRPTRLWSGNRPQPTRCAESPDQIEHAKTEKTEKMLSFPMSTLLILMVVTKLYYNIPSGNQTWILQITTVNQQNINRCWIFIDFPVCHV